MKEMPYTKTFNVNGYFSMFFCHFYKEEQLLLLPVCVIGHCIIFEIGSTLKEKNLLIREPILFFKSYPRTRWEEKMKMKELLPLKVYPFTLTSVTCPEYFII